LRLTELMDGNLLQSQVALAGDPEILGLTADSREVRPGFLFAALPGSKTDGRSFIPDAVAKGAIAVLTSEAAGHEDLARRSPPVHIVADANPRRRLALMAARFHGAQPATLAAVTGTNGKTSTVTFARQLWQALVQKAASLGTLGIVANGIERPGALTTADPVTLHRDLAELARIGIDHAALEASSHGLDQYRLDGLALGLAAFTNLTHDHLDYHVTMDAYFRAKARLFDAVLRPGGTAVLNADIAEFARLVEICRARGHRIIGYGASDAAALRLLARTPLPNGQRLEIEAFGARRTVTLPLVGAFQAMNALAAAGLVIGGGASTAATLDALARLAGVPGRMQHIGTTPSGAPVYVDYAHTPDALENVLAALRPHTQRRLVCVFGAGGDRDPKKRPVMGEVVSRLADVAIVTDDNPRSESPPAIRAAILAASPGAREIGDREAAIDDAVRGLAKGDVLVIAGKGHERGQIVAGVTHPFDDAEVASCAIAGLESQ
jgi:UDP-N-acetylmuramoyl-L-alanyl-D-glutamate--2,6-diaminopimelate ligase